MKKFLRIPLLESYEPDCPGPEPHSCGKHYQVSNCAAVKQRVQTHVCGLSVTHLDLMLLKFLPSERCLMERFLASHTSRVVRSISRPA